MVWQIEIQEPKAIDVERALKAHTSDARAEMKDVYTEMTQGSDLSVLPLVVAAYPAEAANSLLLATSPGTGTTTTQTSTLDVTLPGSDLLVDFSADIDWSLSTNAYSTSSGSSSVTTTVETNVHQHQVTVSAGSHDHTISGTSAKPQSGTGFRVPSDVHTHLMYEFDSSQFVDPANSKFFLSGNGQTLNVGASSDTGDHYTAATGEWATGNVSNVNHTHDIDATTTGAITNVSAVTSTESGSHFHNIDHTHDVGPTDAMLDIKAELLVDDTDITAGLSQFRVEGFTGKRGIIQLRSIYVLQKGAGNASALSGGQHTVGLKFTVSTIGFVATGTTPSTITAKNVALIIRDAAFDDRVKIFTP